MHNYVQYIDALYQHYIRRLVLCSAGFIFTEDPRLGALVLVMLST